MSEALAATARWKAMVDAHREQSQRLRDPAWRPSHDFAPPSVDSFRADRDRADDRCVVEALRRLTTPDSTIVDVGAGAGRLAIPLARSVGRVIAVEPSDAMRAALLADAGRAGVDNVHVVGTRWEETRGVTGDLVMAAHVVYALAEIEPFVARLDAAALQWAAMVAFEEPPLSWLSGFWPRVHGEARLAPPHLPQLVEVLQELGFGPAMVELIDVEPFDLGSPEVARQKLRRRLYVAPGSAADLRLEAAMGELLEQRGDVLVPRTERTVRVGLVRWRPTRRGV